MKSKGILAIGVLAAALIGSSLYLASTPRFSRALNYCVLSDTFSTLNVKAVNSSGRVVPNIQVLIINNACPEIENDILTNSSGIASFTVPTAYFNGYTFQQLTYSVQVFFPSGHIRVATVEAAPQYDSVTITIVDKGNTIG